MKRPRKNSDKTTKKARRRRRRHILRFREAQGKTVEFVEVGTSADFPFVEIGFDDKTALSVIIGSRLTMEPLYADWKTGDQRLLRRWPVRETT